MLSSSQEKPETLTVKLIAYLVVGIAFVASLVFPLVFHYVTPYSAPTAVYATEIMRTGELPTDDFVSTANKAMKSDISAEKAYPLPALVLSMFMLVTGIPIEQAVFIPICGIGGLIFFVLARRILNTGRKEQGYSLLLAAFCYAFITFYWIYGHEIGRGTLGVVFLPYLVYCYIAFLDKRLEGQTWINPWLIMSLLFILASGLTYYTSSVSIIVLMLFMTVALNVSAKLTNRHLYRPTLELSLLVLAIVLLVWSPLLANKLTYLSIERLFQNILDSARFLLGMQPVAGTMATGFVHIDLPTTILRIWVTRIIQLAVGISLIVALFVYRPRKGEPTQMVWLFSVATLLLAVGEFSYLFFTPILPRRFLLMYGIVVLSFVAMHARIKTYSFKKIATGLTIAAMALGSLGSLSYAWNYGMGAAQPFGYDKVSPMAQFLVSHSSQNTPVVITGDASYMGNIFFAASLQHKVNNVIPTRLYSDAIVLHNSLQTGETNALLSNLRRRGIDYLLIVDDERIVWGDSGGPMVALGNTEVLETVIDVTYRDGNSRLFRIRAES